MLYDVYIGTLCYRARVELARAMMIYSRIKNRYPNARIYPHGVIA